MSTPPSQYSVNFGTFSCTVTGFPDAATTLKEVAEYFREVARTDPLFAVSPLSPAEAVEAALRQLPNPKQPDPQNS